MSRSEAEGPRSNGEPVLKDAAEKRGDRGPEGPAPEERLLAGGGERRGGRGGGGGGGALGF